MENSYHATAEVYDDIVDYRTRPDVPFFVECAVESGGPVLELGCGTGRVLIPIARAGIPIIGMDLSAEMLAMCERKLQRESSEVRGRSRLLESDMRDFNLAERFSLVTVPFRPFQHLTMVDDQMSCLSCIHRHLNDDGKLVLDVFNPSLTSLTRANLGLESSAGPDFILADGRQVVHREKIVQRNLEEQSLSIELIYDVTSPDGHTQRLVHAFSMRYFFRYEMEHLLARCGFEVEALYGDYQRHPFGEQYSSDLVYVARKRT